MIKANVGSSNIYSTDDALTGNRALDGDGYSLDLGTAASQLSTFNTEAIGKSVITSGSGTTTSFLSIEKGVQTRLLHQSNVNSIGGSILWNNDGSFDLRNKTNAARMSMIGDIAGNITWKNEDLARGQFAGVVFLCIVGCLWLLKQEQDMWAGALLALGSPIFWRRTQISRVLS
mgnify:CR=1 FL=1